MVNRERPHLMVLPEDDANRAIATGFYLALDWLAQGRMQILPPAGGWTNVLDQFASLQTRALARFQERSFLLLFDFDGEDRLEIARSRVPAGLADRVFVLGTWTEPEQLRRSLGGYEQIGRALAEDCRQGRQTGWSHPLLSHNRVELERLTERVRPFLFS